MLGSRQSTIELEAILSAPSKVNRTKVKSPENFDDLISFEPSSTSRGSNSKKLHRRGSSDSGFSVRKADKREYSFTPATNNLYKGLPASGPLARKNSESFEDLFKPQFVKKKTSTTNTSAAAHYNDSVETIFGNGDHRSPGVAGTVVQKNLTPKQNFNQLSNNNRGRQAVSPFAAEDDMDDIQEIFY